MTSEVSQPLSPASAGNLEATLIKRELLIQGIKNTSITAFYIIIKLHEGLNPT